MHTIPNEDGAAGGRRRRRAHSAEFKAQVVAACGPPGVSIAAVAMAHGVNANLARRWVLAAQQRDGDALTKDSGSTVPCTFVPVHLPPASTQPAHPPPAAAPADIRIELRRGVTVINVSWPCAVASDCAAWMRELLR